MRLQASVPGAMLEVAAETSAKGAGNLAEGTGEDAANLVTLHPTAGAAAVGTGGAKAGKNVGVGTAKGTGRISKGAGKEIGRGIKKIFSALATQGLRRQRSRR